MRISLPIPYHKVILLMAAAGILLAGCTSVFQDLDNWTDRKRFKPAHETFEEGLALYKAGDYANALVRFQSISGDAASETTTRKARLGEACCRLMLAETQADYTAAIASWRDAGKLALGRDRAWEVALLDPLVVRMTPKSTTQVIYLQPPAQTPPPAMTTAVKPPTDDPPPAQTPANGRESDDRRLQSEMALLKVKADQVDRLQRRLDELLDENRSLMEKIKALEAIDQNIQKKKTEIATPVE